MTNHLSRRSIIARAVAGTAATAIPIAASALIAGRPDAELLALGSVCDALYARHAELSIAIAPSWAEFHRREQPLKAAYRRGELDADALINQLIRIEEECGVAGDGGLDDLTDAMDEPMCRIMFLPAHTIEGLAVKAQAAAFSFGRYWREPVDDLDWDEMHLRRLIEAVLTLAGRPLPLTS